MQVPPQSLADHLDFSLLEHNLVSVLRRNLFSGKRSLPPAVITQIGHTVAEAFFRFYQERSPAEPLALGQQLAVAGLGHQAVLQMTETLRRVCSEHSNPLHDVPAVAGGFVLTLLEGYMNGREEILLAEQERTYRAMLRASRSERE